MSQEMVNLTINGRTAQVPKGMNLIEAAKLAGVEIPVFCYHPKLDPAGVCRMCLVQIEGIPKPTTACTTFVVKDTTVHTETERVEQMQRGVLEFLLINHPLDCPVCDKGGECPLQDTTFKFGSPTSRLADPKVRKNKAVQLGPSIILDEERCILCRRCVRFDDEIAAEGNLIIAERGHDNVVTTMGGHPYDSYFGGNTVELCPVGALTSELYRFRARPWDLARVPAVCSGCSVGCNIEMHFRHGQFVRVVAQDNPDTDAGWLCDRGRFNYRWANDARKAPEAGQRLQTPLVRKDGELMPASWPEALLEISRRLQAARGAAPVGGSAPIGLLGGGKLTVEEAYLFQKLGRTVLGTHHIDSRTGTQVVPSLAGYAGRQTDLNDADLYLVVDLLVAERAPVLDLRIRRGLERRRAKLVSIGAAHGSYRVRHGRIHTRPGGVAAVLAELAAALKESGKSDARGGARVDVRPEVQELAQMVQSSKKTAVLWSGGDVAAGRALLDVLAAMHAPKEGRTAHLLIPGEQAGLRHAAAMGCLPQFGPGFKPLGRAAGLSTAEMLRAAVGGELKALYIAGANPAVTFPDGNLAAAALQALDTLIVQDVFLTATAQYADVVLPAAPYPSKIGHYSTLDGLVQKHQDRPAMHPGGACQPDGAIFRAVAAAMGGTLYDNETQLQRELAAAGLKDGGALLPAAPAEILAPAGWPEPVAAAAAETEGAGGLTLVPVERLFAGGGTAHHDPGVAGRVPAAEALLHPQDAADLGIAAGQPVTVRAGEVTLSLTAQVAPQVVRGTVQVPRGLPAVSVHRIPAGTAVAVAASGALAEVGD